MADERKVPYPNFNFAVSFDGDEKTFGGFSDVSGIQAELTVAEYRNGNAAENHVMKVQGLNKTGDVTLKRGLIQSKTIWDWVDRARVAGPAAKKTVTIRLRNEAGATVQTWTLQKVLPLKWTGPTLAGKGGGDVAMEELVLSAEGINYDTPGA